ncbi:ABC transporter permease [Nocardia otitidiscaviarum]|uniref:ABC transporter permease n=1 Tax=Nocardia otitidiscaviarum TaxID=1823 RepID=UPI001895A713|nr:ABC transporter permease [Nocardia otitidiscaviarum]MBF6178078.1 ABC transporter permease [Nocardia otitidiscaviarum]
MIRTVPPAVLQAGTSEVRKVTSLRMNRTMAGALVLVGAIVFTVAGLTVETAIASDGISHTMAAGSALLAVGATLAAAIVLAGIFGAIGSGAEYRYHTLPVSALLTPDRNLLFGSKLAVTAAFAVGTVLLTEVLGLGAFLLFGSERLQLHAWFFGLLGGVLLSALCWALLGAALGYLLRSPVQAVAVIVGWTLLEPLVWLVAQGAGIPGFATVLPVSATLATATAGAFADAAFIAHTPAAIVVLLLWTVGTVTAAWWFLRVRDL